VIADQQQKRVQRREIAGAPDGMAVTQRFILLDQVQAATVDTNGPAVGLHIAVSDHDTDVVDPCLADFLQENPQCGLFRPVAVYQCLEAAARPDAGRRR
jgi:hypothetical protein